MTDSLGPSRRGLAKMKGATPSPLASFFGRSSFSDRQQDADDRSQVDPAKIPWNYGSPEEWWENYKARRARAAPWLALWGVFCCAIVIAPQLPAEWILLGAALAGAGVVAGVALRRLHRSHAHRFTSLGLSVHGGDDHGDMPPKAETR